MDDARQELVIDVDRERAALYGLSTAQVGGTIRSAVQGTEAAKFRQGENEYDIVVRLAGATGTTWTRSRTSPWWRRAGSRSRSRPSPTGTWRRARGA
jgi:multidrug efflux pump subunit AcrB